MPFTVSHVAAVLPATRAPALRDPLVVSAMAIGAMAPDVPYFVPLQTWLPSQAWSTLSHTWVGLVTFDLPVTLVLVALYWLVLAAPLRALAPDGVRARIPRDVLASHRRAPLRALGWVVVGAAFGAATHIVWDAFTHGSSAYPVAQPVSTVVGLLALAWVLVRWYQETPATVAGAGLGWPWRLGFAGSVLVAGLLAWWSAVVPLGVPGSLAAVQYLLIAGVTHSLGLMVLVALIAALPVQVRLRASGAGEASRVPVRLRGSFSAL